MQDNRGDDLPDYDAFGRGRPDGHDNCGCVFLSFSTECQTADCIQLCFEPWPSRWFILSRDPGRYLHRSFELADVRNCSMLGKFILSCDYLVSKFRLLPPLHFPANYVLTSAGGDTYLKLTFGADECLFDGSTISLDSHGIRGCMLLSFYLSDSGV